ncbi:MAG: Ig-like domain-containing protein, partial [Deltaproteobacteria bacterium]|nr:Ig-like domain-containing protein [Deltaproteobacteria bacterium]
LAIDSKDNLFVGLTFNVGTFFTSSTDGGATWSQALQLLDGGWGTWDYLPSLSVDSKDIIHAAFHAQYGWQVPPSNIFYTYSTDKTTFSQAENISKLPQEQQYGNGAGPANIQAGKNDEIFIMSGRNITGDTDGYSILFHYSNSLWLDAIRLNDESVYGTGGDFVIDSNGILHLFFAQINPVTQNRQIVYKTYNPETKTLTYQSTITTDSENAGNISAGIYENDLILVAYDIYDNIAKKYNGVYLKKSDDSFVKTYAISEIVGARNPNLRSSYYNMHNKDKQDIIWIEPDTTSGGEILAYYQISGGIKPTGKATVDVFVPYFMNPGQEAIFVVRYSNFREEDITNAAIVMDVPSDLLYLNHSGEGIYKDREGSPQVFWKLGTLKSGTKGSQFAKFYIPWGMPEVEGKIVANLIGENIYSNYDTKKYYAYESRDITSQTDLTEADIDTLLKSDKELNDLLNYSKGLGYIWHKVGQKIELSNQKTITTLFLMDPNDFSPLMIKRVSGMPVFAEQTQGPRYTRFDTNGGYTTNSASEEFISFGSWAESHSLTAARCQLNCTINKVPGWIGDAASKTYNMASSGLNCISCAKSKGKEIADCINCMNAYKDVPGVSYGVDVAQCLDDCLNNPNQHICTEDKKECNWSILGYYFFGTDTVFTTKCNKVTGTYAPLSSRTYCEDGTKCVDGKCVPKDENPCNPKTVIAPAQEVGVCKLDSFKVVPAHDPNAISVVPDGDILPDETLTYTIEYENTGGGTAYNVFIINQLDENLDENSLKINDNGKFSSASRLLTWQIGELAAGQKGSVTYSVKPKKDIPLGTVISNFAEVHFPSAGEVTPTNIVASKISNLSADNKQIEVGLKEKKSITLTARGPNDVKFRIISYPKFGSIKLNLPEVEYTAPDNFTGTDRFTYTAFKGENESSPATVSINIKGDDKTPPSVIQTYPEDKAEKIRFNSVAAPDGTFLPEIWVKFNEDIDKNSAQPYNIYILENGSMAISANIMYDPTTRRIFARPLSALKPATEYTVKIAYIYDKSQNVMEGEYTFKFKTVSNKELDIALSDKGETLNFGKISLKNSAENKTVSLSSIGPQAVNITDVKLEQNEKEFSIVEDKCSGKLLSDSENCHITIGFSPVTKGIKNAKLTITSDDDVNPAITVSIMGEGVEQTQTDAGTDTGSTQDGTGTSTESKDNGGCGCSYIE